jgi:Xaa-Pro aminopeptidase
MLVHTERLKTKLAEHGLDGLIATTLENVHYFSGIYSVSLSMFPYEGQMYAVVTADQPTEPFLVGPTVEIDQSLDAFPGVRGAETFGTFYREPPHEVELVDWEPHLTEISVNQVVNASPVDALVKILQRAGLADKKVGIDELGLRDGYLEQLKEKLPQAEFVRVNSLLRWVRRVKTEEEVNRLRSAARITERAIVATSGIAREGITEYELAREFERSIVSQGAIPRFTLIRAGRNAVAGQVLPNRTPLKRGDTIWFDVGCTYKGYWADIARNVSLGEPSQRARAIYEAMKIGEEYAIAEVRAGMSGKDVFELTMKATREAGAPHYRRHHVGHNIGAEVYEQPIMAPNNEELIEIGTIVNIETPYYEFGLGALHVEDPFVVRENSNEVLTTLTRDLIVVE